MKISRFVNAMGFPCRYDVQPMTQALGSGLGFVMTPNAPGFTNVAGQLASRKPVSG
jgi:hypothetical protein